MEISNVHRPCKHCGHEIGNNVFMLCNPCWFENFQKRTLKTVATIKLDFAIYKKK